MKSTVVIINSCRRPIELVIRSLRAVLSQQHLPAKLILIDQNLEPIPLPSDITENPLFERQTTHHQSVSEARNSVQLPPNCEWICFCDDDGYWAPDFSENLHRLLSNPAADVFAGAVLREDSMDYYSLRHKVGGDLNQFKNLKLLMGSNFCVKKTVFDRVGRFDERFGVGAYWGSSEETDFAWKCYFAKVPMRFSRELRVIHVPPFNESFKKGWFKSYRYAVGKGAMVGKWLWEMHEPTVLLEFFEMLLIPPIQILRGILTLKFSLSFNNLGVFLGRIIGFVRFPGADNSFKRDKGIK